MKNILVVLGLLAIVAASYFVYQKFFAFDPIRIVESIKHELSATEEFVFSRDNMKFSEREHSEKFLAHIDYLYTWEANVPFGFSPDDLSLSFNKEEKKLNVTVNALRLYPMHVHNQKAEKTSEFGWLNQGEPAKIFWENINEHTHQLINKELESKPNEAGQIKSITKNSMIVSIGKILSKLDLHEVTVEVLIKDLELYNGKHIAL